MALTLTEKLDSRKWNTGDNASVEMVYILTGTSDDLTAKTLIENSTAENYNGLTVGPITGISKKGWEYMWVRYADAEDAAAKAIVKKPVAVYIEKVYEEGSFAGLGIGT